jgi:hypothetical protein
VTAQEPPLLPPSPTRLPELEPLLPPLPPPLPPLLLESLAPPSLMANPELPDDPPQLAAVMTAPSAAKLTVVHDRKRIVYVLVAKF